jgi:hypothetical protein
MKHRILSFFFCIGAFLPINVFAARYQSISIENADRGLPAKAASIFQRIVKDKAGYDLCNAKGKSLRITLSYDRHLKAESFRISKTTNHAINIAGGDDYGIMYGLGKVLHCSYISPQGFELGKCEGISVPDKPVRGIYLATHFHNFYNDAPIQDVADYIEELAMWGYNALQVWFDMHHYTGINDPEAQKMISRLKQLLEAGRDVGMKSGLTMLANESYNNTPKELRSERIKWTGFYGCEICPSKPGGTELILKQRREMLEVFANIGLEIDNIWLWPYDQGGCSCEDCSPWGANGYLKLTKKLAQLIHEQMPKTKVVLSTWLFDFEEHDKGEWKGLAEALAKEKPWVDYLMADSHTKYPRYLLSHPVPGNLPLLNFPEISMWENYPWGGYGANPLPMRFEGLWREIAHLTSGGYPYSEGKFEDFNKVLYSQFYWSAGRDAKDILKEYVTHEFSKKYADDIIDAILILEKNIGMKTVNWFTHKDAKKEIHVPDTDFGAQKAYAILSAVNKKLSPSVRQSWRWRIIYLRGYLDYALRESKGQIMPDINSAFKELNDISKLSKDANFVVRPPFLPGT